MQQFVPDGTAGLLAAREAGGSHAPSHAVPAGQCQVKAHYMGNDPRESMQHHDRTLLEVRQAVIHEGDRASVPSVSLGSRV